MGCTIDYVKGDKMTYKGFIKTGHGYDSKRENWDEVKDLFGGLMFNGTLNVKLYEEVKLDSVDYDFEVFDFFRVKKGVLKFNNVEKEVYVCFKFNIPVFPTFFIVSDVKLRDELKLEDGDTVEVIL